MSSVHDLKNLKAYQLSVMRTCWEQNEFVSAASENIQILMNYISQSNILQDISFSGCMLSINLPLR